MTDSIKVTTVATSIAGLTIPVTNARGQGVNLIIRDVNAIKVAINPQDCPALTPIPNGFVSNIVPVRSTYGGDAAYKDIKYTLLYRFFFAPVAEGIEVFASYGDMVTSAIATYLYLTTNTQLIAGQTDFLPASISQFGQVDDAIGTLFHGCDMQFDVLQYLET